MLTGCCLLCLPLQLVWSSSSETPGCDLRVQLLKGLAGVHIQGGHCWLGGWWQGEAGGWGLLHVGCLLLWYLRPLVTHPQHGGTPYLLGL